MTYDEYTIECNNIYKEFIAGNITEDEYSDALNFMYELLNSLEEEVKCE